MANWRTQQGQSHHQMRHWRPFSNRNPPLDRLHSTVPAWEKKFCASIGSVPWPKLVESRKYMYLYDNVVKWDDFAVKEAFDNAKMRYWAGINGIPCNLALPDPDIYIDNVDWNATIDPELIMDLEKEEVKGLSEGEEDAEIVLVDGKLFRNQQYVPPTGWGDDDEFEEPKSFDPTFAAQGWGSPLQQYDAPLPLEHAKEYGNGYIRKRENISWCKTPHAYNGNNEYHHMNRGRRNYRGGRGRGKFVYVPKEMPSPTA